jgi:hypothetical protein
MTGGRRSRRHSFQWRYEASPAADYRSQSAASRRRKVELQKLCAPLVHRMIRHDEHRLFRQVQAVPTMGYHPGGCARRRSSDAARDLHRGGKYAPFRARLGANRQNRAAECWKRTLYSLASRSALSRSSHTQSRKTLFQRLLLLARSNRFRLIYGPPAILVLVVGRRRASI